MAIVGGWSQKKKENAAWDLNLSNERNATLIQACKDVGRRLAEKRHTVIVGSDEPNSADRHVVAGMLTALQDSDAPEPLIHLIQGIHGEGDLYAEQRQSERDHKFFTASNSRSPGQTPRAAEKILAVKDADALIAIGGLEATYVAGIAALVARKTVVPIASFHGAALQLWHAANFLGNGRDSDDFQRLSDEVWHADLLDAAFRFGGLDQPRVFLGSSGKARETALKLKECIESLGFNVLYWETGFESGRVILDQIQAASFSCKYAVLLLTPDEQIAGETSRWLPRDNVLFELGYFISALGADCVRAIVQEGTTVLADYGGHIYISLKREAAVSSIENDLRRFLSADLS
ncbi:MAG: TIR domain-containing protein [Gemmatimonadaceae bacterium]